MPFHLFVGERKHLFSISIGIRFASIRRQLNNSIIYIQANTSLNPFLKSILILLIFLLFANKTKQILGIMSI